MHWLNAPFAVLAGVSNPLQSASNSALLKGMHVPIVAACVVYLTGAACLALCTPLYGFGLRAALTRFSGVPWWAYIGGICNALFLMCSLLITRRLGSATFTKLVVFSAVVTSVVIAHFGLMGFELRPAGALRLLGSAFAIAGVLLIANF
ncbi:membrane protein (plasmid) [Burkholderia sp. THE68]|uniref:DMT family transporter n=1 Tax=Burkholderia sp. THE68 TaxID=758782 RepID=UPI0013160FD9|nr:DMT family transporter [Burkholderia sp. THE68]BBU33541.1 membrane protein [Burkholderia sp. THE68]